MSSETSSGEPRTVVSTGRGDLFRAWLPVVVLGALAAPVAWRGWIDGGGEDSLLWTLGGGALVAMLLVSFVYALRRTLAWRRYGRLELELDPMPGSLGGHVGGSIVLPISSAERPELRVSLSCVRVEVRRTTKGKRRWDTLVWTREMVPRIEPATRGLRTRFTFSVPEGLPESEPPSEAYHVWKVRVQGSVPGVDLDRAFTVPVRRTPEPLEARNPALPTEEPPSRRRLRTRTLRVEPEPDGVSLRFSMERNAKSGLGFSVFGLLCGGVPLAIWWFEGGGSPWSVFDLFTILFGGVFVLFGAFFLVLGLYLLLNTLHVRLSGSRIRSVRRVLFVPFAREAPTPEVERVEATIRGQVGQGAEAEAIYEIRAFLRGGGHVVLGDGISGTDLAERLLRLIEEVTGVAGRIVPRGEWSKARVKVGRAGS